MSIELKPLSREHFSALEQFGSDESIWRSVLNPKDSPQSFAAYLEDVLKDAESGTTVPFSIWATEENRIIGLTRLKSIDSLAKRAETGTWLHPEFQGRGLNRLIKDASLRVAFEELHLDEVYCYVRDDNKHSIRSLLHYGFKIAPDRERRTENLKKEIVNMQYLSIVRVDWLAAHAPPTN